ncbi:MAG: cyanophycinase [Lewinellaceae bacterium]|nr:cyanophycinase [Phaeodactylibacter sp.]MCB9036471.1 cyanophycinase [Lewinellaceae bacterium]
MKFFYALLLLPLLSLNGFSQAGISLQYASAPAGKLFIIGGGKRPPALVQAMVAAAGLDTAGYAIILPMASGEPDSAAYYGIRQFVELGLPAAKFRACNFEKGSYPKAAIDSLRGARLVYIAGGDQNRFMDVVLGSPVYEAIHEAYRKGATIAGTSAGAAVMSRRMITGNEYKHPDYTGDFRTIEAENIEMKEGLGLLPNAIVDQHFIYRMRMNRLMSAALEHPGQACIGIDESTAILVEGNSATVVGDSQVILLRNPGGTGKKENGLLGGRGLELSILLPGEKFDLK